MSAGMFTVALEYDADCTNPTENDGAWTPYSFNRRHVNFADPDALGIGPPDAEGVPTIRNPGLRSKLRAGLAFFLSYSEHGRCQWSLLDAPDAYRCPFDSVRIAGLLVWEHPPGDMGAKSLADRAKDAASFVAEYTAWCNGDGYGYRITDADGEETDSCWGFLGDPDYMLDEIAYTLPVGATFTVIGEAADYLAADLRARVAARNMRAGLANLAGAAMVAGRAGSAAEFWGLAPYGQAVPA